MGVLVERPTVWVSNIPQTIIAKDLLRYLETQLGQDSVFAIEIHTERRNWKSRGVGRVQFTSLDFKTKALNLSLDQTLVFKSHCLKISETYADIISRPIKDRFRVEYSVLHAGFMRKEERLCVLESWEGVRGWLMPERRKLEFWVWQRDKQECEECCYKLEISFEDILETVGCFLDGEVNGILLQLKYGPKIYQKISGPNVATKFRNDQYHICKEDFDFLWVRTTDFSVVKSIGQSTSFCWEIEDGLLASDIFSSFPYLKEDKKQLILEDGEEFCSTSETVPLVKCGPVSNLAYEVLFQLNSLVHTQKISLAAVDGELIEILSGLAVENALMILQKLQKLKSTCYDPEIQKFFVDYMINDTLGAISTAHLVQADRDPMKARSAKCLQLAALHSMAVDFAKTGAPAEMPLALRPREFPDFMERVDKPLYISSGVLGKLYRATLNSVNQIRANEPIWSEKIAVASYDNELQVDGFEAFLGTAEIHRDMYEENMSMLMNFYGTKTEDELLTGNMRNKPGYLQYCNNRYRDMKDRILLSVKNVQKEAKEWFESSCQAIFY
ncbi:hypothetical protein Pint_15407 [Pistacia integerrima]|uniref:Uncharacterized protein n=1 Tax=Pistacia integerrima TaxID=434235 RepID=A0ACC0ZDW8_9ROSI|nr:hypothetical protein Pint_15407 [Pistacia integerrima]